MARAHLSVLALSAVASVAVSPAAGQRQPQDYGISQVSVINREILRGWEESQLRPALPAEGGEWARRVYLDILGRIPRVDELQSFLRDTGRDKKAVLVDRLLFDPRYEDEYARNWTTIWANVLIGRSGGTEANSLTSRTGLQEYLRDAFARNRPYDELVYELITATGANEPGREDFNGAVNFLAMKVNDDKATLATAATARIFLGQQVQCTQCHNHPFNEWKQQRFWELNAFFRQTRALRRFAPGSRDVAYATVVDEDFRGEDRGGDPREAAVFYEMRNGLLRVAYPVFVDGTEAGRSGLVRELNRRQALGKMILQSSDLARTLVNRYWAHFLGHGFTTPLDDLGSHNPPSHPALLDNLAAEVRAGGYDVKDLVRWIALSRPYALSSRMHRGNEADDPRLGVPPKFSRFYLRQMRPEELYESILTAGASQAGSDEERERRKSAWLRRFVRAVGNDEGEESTTFDGTISQALEMFHGELVRGATRAEPGGVVWQVAFNGQLAPREKVQYLFLAGLARYPTRDDYELANQLFYARAREPWEGQRLGRRAAAPGDGNATIGALEDLWWAILNSNEFILNH